MKNQKKKGRVFRQIRFILINILVAAALCGGVIFYINHGIVTVADLPPATPTAEPSPTPTATPSPTPVPTPTPSPTPGPERNAVPWTPETAPGTLLLKTVILTDIPSTAACVNLSFDGQYVSYLDGGALYIRSIADGHIAETTTGSGGVQYALMVSGADLVLYFSVDSSNKLHIDTYNIVSGATLSYKPFSASADAAVKTVAYDVNTNLIYVVLENGPDKDTMYRITVNNAVRTQWAGKSVSAVVPTSNSNDVYFQTADNALYLNNAAVVALKGRQVRFLGRGADDTLYLLPQDTPDYVVTFRDGAVTGGFDIPPGAAGFSGDYDKIYAVYNDYVIDLTSANRQKLLYDSRYAFCGIVNNTLYLMGK